MKTPVLAQLERDALLEPAFLARLKEEREAETEEDFGERTRDHDPRAKEVRETPPHLDVLRLCQVGALRGGLSVALDVRADELTGALCAAIGGTARKVKLLDVRELGRDVLELEVMLGEVQERWEVEDLYALIHNLNDLLRADGGAKAVAVLGEWQDMLQLWCLDKSKLPELFGRRYFAPRNHHQLRTLVPQ